MKIPARTVSFLLFLLALALNEWAFEIFFPSKREVDYFVRLLVLILTVFCADVIGILFFFGKNLSLVQTLKKISQLFPKLTAFYSGLILSFILFCVAEFGTRYYFRHYYQPPVKDITEWNPKPTKPDSLFAYRLPENTIINHRYIVNDTLIYERKYVIDEFSRRTTLADSAKKEKFIAVAGCSFAFGYGVNDDETLVAFLQKNMPGYAGYNYGVSGYGTQHLLLQTREKITPAEIKEGQGILIYFFIDNHINRLIGSRRILKLWGENFPYFYLDENKELRQNGTFNTGRKWKTLVYKTLTASALIDIMDLELPLKTCEKDFKLAAAVITESKKEFENNFPGSHFVVLFFPGSRYSGELGALLAKQHIDFIDCSKLFASRSPEFLSHYSDPHPNGKAYRAIAEKLKSVLKQ